MMRVALVVCILCYSHAVKNGAPDHLEQKIIQEAAHEYKELKGAGASINKAARGAASTAASAVDEENVTTATKAKRAAKYAVAAVKKMKGPTSAEWLAAGAAAGAVEVAAGTSATEAGVAAATATSLAGGRYQLFSFHLPSSLTNSQNKIWP